MHVFFVILLKSENWYATFSNFKEIPHFFTNNQMVFEGLSKSFVLSFFYRRIMNERVDRKGRRYKEYNMNTHYLLSQSKTRWALETLFSTLWVKNNNNHNHFDWSIFNLMQGFRCGLTVHFQALLMKNKAQVSQ